jgi:hypothetical protein
MTHSPQVVTAPGCLLLDFGFVLQKQNRTLQITLPGQSEAQ